jgi:hypothetical protein
MSYKFLEKKKNQLIFLKLKHTIIDLLFLFVLTYEHDAGIRHIHCIVHLHIETRENYY